MNIINHIFNPFTYTDSNGAKRPLFIQNKAAKATLVVAAYLFAIPTLGVTLLALYVPTALKKRSITKLTPNDESVSKTNSIRDTAFTPPGSQTNPTATSGTQTQGGATPAANLPQGVGAPQGGATPAANLPQGVGAPQGGAPAAPQGATPPQGGVTPAANLPQGGGAPAANLPQGVGAPAANLPQGVGAPQGVLPQGAPQGVLPQGAPHQAPYQAPHPGVFPQGAPHHGAPHPVAPQGVQLPPQIMPQGQVPAQVQPLQLNAKGYFNPVAVVGQANASYHKGFYGKNMDRTAFEGEVYTARDQNIKSILDKYLPALQNHFNVLLSTNAQFQKYWNDQLIKNPNGQQYANRAISTLSDQEKAKAFYYYLEQCYLDTVRQHSSIYTIPSYPNDYWPKLYAYNMTYIMQNLSHMPDSIKDLVGTTMQKTFLFTDPYFKTKFPTGEALLGRGDVLVTPCKMDFGWNWKKQQPQQEFALLNAAAINIGEKGIHSDDFRDYSYTQIGKGNWRYLDENKYVGDMQHIAGNLLNVAENGKMKDVVWFPFGMGAFLREVPDQNYAIRPAIQGSPYNPTVYQNDGSYRLRKRLAAGAIAEFRKHPNMTVHLCLPQLEPGDKLYEETQQNYNAFIEELANAPLDVRSRVKIYTNSDATQVAQSLADQKGEYQVAMINGANQKLIGNHCYENEALNAIDEGIHRRSAWSLEASILCNGIVPITGIRGSRQPVQLIRSNANKQYELAARVGIYAKMIPPQFAGQHQYHYYGMQPDGSMVGLG